MTLSEARTLLTTEVTNLLEKLGQTRQAYLPDALINAGVPPRLALAMVASCGPAERARVSLTGRKRELTTRYIWGPDIPSYIRGWQ